MADGTSRTPRWFVPLLLVLLGGIGGVVFTLLAKPTYTASSFVVVTATPATGDRRDVSLAQALGRLVTTPEVVAPTATALGVPPDQVTKAVQGRTSPDAPIIEISGTAAAAQRAADLVNGVANGLVMFGTTKMNVTGVTVSVLSAASPPTSPSSPNLVLDLAVGVGAGVLLGALWLLATGGRKRGPRPGTVGAAAASLPGAVGAGAGPRGAPLPGQVFPPPDGRQPPPPGRPQPGPPRGGPGQYPPAGPNQRPGPPGPPYAPVPPQQPGGGPRR